MKEIDCDHADEIDHRKIRWRKLKWAISDFKDEDEDDGVTDDERTSEWIELREQLIG